MFKLTCKKLGDETCDFAAMGETAEEAMGKMKEHAAAAHPQAAKEVEGMTEEAHTNKMMGAMEQV